ncbi:MAG: oxidoreductase [Rhodospirillaceae bacterium]|nr:oxidoreductase [Rhodospirillaceae bacterium]
MGLGTWHMGERLGDHDREARALSRGLDLGMTVIDTAEMYGRGGAERVVSKAIEGRRDEVFIISKVLPHNASRHGTIEACEKSLKRMGIETIDLYLLHWQGRYSLTDTVAAFQELKRTGKIRHWGVSNFDTDEMEALSGSPDGNKCQTNQVLYNLSRRGVEWDLLPWCASHMMPVMAYSPLEQGRLASEEALKTIASAKGVTALQLALAWCLQRDGVMVIPKASHLEHVEQNRVAGDIELEVEEIRALDCAFPPPTGKRSLEIL